MKVFLITYSYHKGKWAGRAEWPKFRIFAESASEARKVFLDNTTKGYGFRLESIEDVTGKPHQIKQRTVF